MNENLVKLNEAVGLVERQLEEQKKQQEKVMAAEIQSRFVRVGLSGNIFGIGRKSRAWSRDFTFTVDYQKITRGKFTNFVFQIISLLLNKIIVIHFIFNVENYKKMQQHRRLTMLNRSWCRLCELSMTRSGGSPEESIKTSRYTEGSRRISYVVYLHMYISHLWNEEIIYLFIDVRNHIISSFGVLCELSNCRSVILNWIGRQFEIVHDWIWAITQTSQLVYTKFVLACPGNLSMSKKFSLFKTFFLENEERCHMSNNRGCEGQSLQFIESLNFLDDIWYFKLPCVLALIISCFDQPLNISSSFYWIRIICHRMINSRTKN